MKIVFSHCSDALRHADRSKTFGIYYSDVNNPDPAVHTHNCCELLFCLQGGKQFLINDRLYDVGNGDLFVINQYEAHKITFSDGQTAKRYVIQIHPDFLFSASSDETDLSRCFYHRTHPLPHRVSLHPSEQKDLLSLLRRLEQSYPVGDELIKRSLMTILLAETNRLFSAHQPTEDADPFSPQLRAAVMYINRHFSEPLTLEIIAKNCYLSVNRLCALFRETLGTTVIQYLIGKRISEAKKYLKAGYSVSETALQCGFGDYANFIRTFTAKVGISPGKYAKNQ